jgi:hypothetical protein
MLSAHKRTNPFMVSEVPDEEVLMDVCSSHKRGRWEENAPLRKRSINQANLQPEPTFTLKDIERAREEGRMQAVNKLKAVQTANEVLKQALQETVHDRDKLANDCKVLKAGVVTLNNKNTQLARDLEITANQLREECERSKALQSALIAVHANWSLGGCRKDDQMGPGPSYDGDVF